MTTMMKGATTTLTRNINRSAHGLLNFGGANAMQMRQFRAGIRVSPRRCYFGARNFVQPSLQRVNRREGVCSLHADSIRQSSTTTTTTVASSFCFPFDKRFGLRLSPRRKRIRPKEQKQKERGASPVSRNILQRNYRNILRRWRFFTPDPISTRVAN